mmetsp:Transcript_51749/g.129901  ORF Transcript_51749/g.129901 Transcript_51749/m.129901 type:complete len:183 (+) Transcript_51749:152-700(+)
MLALAHLHRSMRPQRTGLLFSRSYATVTENKKPVSRVPFCVGDSHSESTQWTDARVRAFASLSGDNNPIHLDEESGRRSMFGQRVVHGHACASVISGIMGRVLPGPGSIYLSQSLHYRAPVFVDDWIETTVTITNICEDRPYPVITLRTELRKEDGTLATEGEAVGMCPQFAAAASSDLDLE